MTDINKWPMIKLLNDDFVKTIKFVYIYYCGQSVICFTNDDNVYSYGNNDSGYLGLGHENPIDKPTLIEELCNKQVCDIKLTSNSLIAITKSGQIYSWGINDCGQLGNGNNDDCLKPAIINTINEEIVVDVECGDSHCLALTQNGHVFEWGWSVSGRNNTIPIKVIGLENHKISGISCGEYHSLVLTDNGDVFSWGDNSYGQCGTGSYGEQVNAIKINLSEKIIKISCGPNHSLLLTENQDIYAFGSNDCGQLGDGTERNSNLPLKIDISTKFVDILTDNKYKYNISIGLSRDGYCFVWGKCGKRNNPKPTKTQIKRIDEALLIYSEYKVTFKPCYISREFEELSILSRIKYVFNEPEFTDTKFKIDGKLIHVHSTYLRMVCKHFRDMFAPNVWLESNANEIEITQYSYSVYFSFLKYLYTDSVDIEIEHIIDLYNLADSYIEEDLKYKCINIMKNHTNINNVFNYWSFAAQNNLSELENFFFDYMKTRMEEVIETDSYLQMNDISIYRKLIQSIVHDIE